MGTLFRHGFDHLRSNHRCRLTVSGSHVELRRLAKKRGLKVVDRGNGHIQITGGPMLVNYYPESKRRTAYVAATRRGKSHVSPEQAIEMCFEQPPVQRAPSERKRRKKSQKMRLFNKQGGLCRWCGDPMNLINNDPNSATWEHVIPLARGGLDHVSNLALAHKRCNHERGDTMRELENSAEENNEGEHHDD